ncbi:MAG: sulfatase-like hydrolase/transferase [Candidatus Hydrogenedens sp.]|nr:sulfatase-like hydrolase/transferase [Candidatus Hydrogenedens sp.]
MLALLGIVCRLGSSGSRPGGRSCSCGREGSAHMRSAILLILLLALGLAMLASSFMLGAPTDPPPAGPNVVLIVVDTLRADRILAERNGVPVMPNLAEFAKKGRLYINAVSAASWTRPAVTSLITGQYMGTHGVVYGVSEDADGKVFADNINPRWPVLAETLAAAGYQTGAVTTNGHLQPNTSFDQGYEPARYLYEEDAPADRVGVHAQQLLRSARAPFFHYLHYMDPHAPYRAPKEYSELFGPEPTISDSDREVLDPENHIRYISDQSLIRLGRRRESIFQPLSEAGREVLRQRYDAECRFADEHIAATIANIRKFYPKTLFIITADHGEEFWEHGGTGHGLTLFQEQIHVPLIIVGPRVLPRMVTTVVESVGIYKTLLAYLGLNEPLPLQGSDLLAEAPGNGAAYSMTRGPSLDYPVDLDAALEASGKAIRDNGRGITEIYNLETDPAEQHPLAEDPARWNQVLDAHAAESERIRPPRIQPIQKAVDAKFVEQMRKLGYKKEE